MEIITLQFYKITPELISYINICNCKLLSIIYISDNHYSLTFNTNSPDPVTQYIYNNFTEILISE